MKTLAERESEWIARFAVIGDLHERMAAIAGFKPLREPLANHELADEHLVHGCASRVWIVGNFENGRCFFRTNATSPMVRGLVALLGEIYSGATLAEIVRTDPTIWAALDLERNLSPTRLHGLAQVRGVIRKFAEQFLAAAAENEAVGITRKSS